MFMFLIPMILFVSRLVFPQMIMVLFTEVNVFFYICPTSLT